MPKIRHDYTHQCELKIVLPAPLKRSSGVFILSVSQNQMLSLEALLLLKYSIRFTIGQLVKSTHRLNRWTMTSASTSLPSLHVKLLNSWSWAKSRVPRAPSQFPNYVDLRGQNNLANVSIKGRTEAYNHYRLWHHGFCQYPLGWFNYKLFETCFSVANLGLIHRLNLLKTN